MLWKLCKGSLMWDPGALHKKINNFNQKYSSKLPFSATWLKGSLVNQIFGKMSLLENNQRYFYGLTAKGSL